MLADFSSFGVPPVTGVPTLFCKDKLNPQIGYIADVSSNVTLTKALLITLPNTDVGCSWAGGCSLIINADGLTSAMKNQSNSITVGGSPCTVDFDLSSATATVCKIPPMATTWSVENYKIAESGTLNATIFPNDPALYDGNL